MLFLIFTRFFPTVAQSEVKEGIVEDELGDFAPPRGLHPAENPSTTDRRLVAVFASSRPMIFALQQLLSAGFQRVDVVTPMKIPQVLAILGYRPSPVRLMTLCGAILGCLGGFGLAIYAAELNGIIVGGKHPLSLVPYCVIGFEGTVLIGSLFNLGGLLRYARLWPGKHEPQQHDGRLGRDKMAIILAVPPSESARAASLLTGAHAEEVYAR